MYDCNVFRVIYWENNKQWLNFQEVKNTKKCVGKSSLVKRSKTTLLDLNEDVLELIVGYLDTESALNLFRVCKTINARLEGACGFWYQLCSKEKFIVYHALKQSDDINPEHPLWDYRWHHSKPPPTATPPVRKKRRTNDSSSRGGRGSDDEKVGDQVWSLTQLYYVDFSQ